MEENSNWVDDVIDMHEEKGFYEPMYLNVVMQNLVKEFLEFRYNFLLEEIEEGKKAIQEKNPEDVIDSLIDICVVAITTLDLLDVDANVAWKEVMRANNTKEIGIKEGRPNPLNLPDMKKPENFVGPDHSNNLGFVKKIKE